MALEYILTEKEFIKKRIGGKVVFGNKPIDQLGAFEDLTEFKVYEIFGRYRLNEYSYGFLIRDNTGKVRTLHASFFLSSK